MSVGEMSIGEMSVGEMSVGEMSWIQLCIAVEVSWCLEGFPDQC